MSRHEEIVADDVRMTEAQKAETLDSVRGRCKKEDGDIFDTLRGFV